jgi:hypothetical protein
VFIRTKDEAMAALSEILELPERRDQIIQSTVKVAVCMTVETRRFMLDVQAGILSGGLDGLRAQREKALASMRETQVRRRAPGIDVKNDALLQSIGGALDLLKMVGLLFDTFPAVKARHPNWEVARFIHQNPGYVRDAVEAGLRRRGKPEHAALEKKVLERIEEKKPWWPEWADSIRHACVHYSKTFRKDDVNPAANDPETLFYVVIIDEERAQEVLRRMAGTSDRLAQYLSEIRARVDLVLSAQEQAAS